MKESLAGAETLRISNSFELSKSVAVPSVLEAPIAFELKLDRIIPVGGDHLVLGIVERVQVDSSANAGNYKTAAEL